MTDSGQVTSIAVCPSGTTLSGGGFYIENATDPSQYAILENRPTPATPTSSWTVSMNGHKTITLTAYALCQSLVTWSVSIGIIDAPVITSSHEAKLPDGLPNAK
jgi:hypothetical protein